MTEERRNRAESDRNARAFLRAKASKSAESVKRSDDGGTAALRTFDDERPAARTTTKEEKASSLAENGEAVESAISTGECESRARKRAKASFRKEVGEEAIRGADLDDRNERAGVSQRSESLRRESH